MKRATAALLILSAGVAHASADVPEVKDPFNIVIDNKKTSQYEFLKKYCVGKFNNETCAKVSYAMRMTATKGTMPKGW